MSTEQQAFDLLKAKVNKEHQHLIQWRHVTEVLELIQSGCQDIQVKHQDEDPGYLDHPDWEDWRQPAQSEDLVITAIV